MAKKNLYCIKDVKVGYLGIFEHTNDATAAREFSLMCRSNVEGNMIQRFPQDYELYRVGTFDDKEGSFENSLQYLVSAIDCLGTVDQIVEE